MIEQTNIRIQNKDTKKIYYTFYLDNGSWFKREHDYRGYIIYYEDSIGDWYKAGHDYRGYIIYYENTSGVKRDDRKIQHTNRRQTN
jgi:hypothetical protein